MISPRGCLASISTTLGRLARNGDVEGIRDYLSSGPFMVAFAGLNPEQRQSVMRSFARAEALCEARARHPSIKPRRIDAKRSEKVSWSDPAMRVRLSEVYARVGGDDEKAVRILGVTLGSARLVRKRHLDSAARDQS